MEKAKQQINKLIKQVAPLAYFLLLISYFSSPAAHAAGARLFLSPPSGNYYVGSYFSVDVRVDTGGNKTNAYKAVLAYPTDKLEAIAVSTGGSICSLWITQSKTTFECGAIQPYAGPDGKIGTIIFVARASGTAVVSVASGNVKKADGSGAELLSTREAVSFTLQDLPANVPVVSSATHPNQNNWYPIKSAELSWSKPEGTTGFSYLLSQNPQDVPDDTAEEPGTTKTFNDLADGAWYFHIKAQIEDGWSSTNHFRLQIDSEPPLPFEIVSDQKAERVTRAPLLSFATTDDTSGIDRYEISIDGSTPLTTSSPYQFERIRGGERNIIVRAFDLAGNTRDAALNLSVISVPTPTINQPSEGETIPFLSPLKISAAAAAQIGKAEFLIDGNRIGAQESGAGQEVSHTYQGFLTPGEHTLEAIFINADGIESEPAKVAFKVDAGMVYLFGPSIPGYIFYPLFLATLGGLGWLGRRWILVKVLARH